VENKRKPEAAADFLDNKGIERVEEILQHILNAEIY
jgi:hypothetical protein